MQDELSSFNIRSIIELVNEKLAAKVMMVATLTLQMTMTIQLIETVDNLEEDKSIMIPFSEGAAVESVSFVKTCRMSYQVLI